MSEGDAPERTRFVVPVMVRRFITPSLSSPFDGKGCRKGEVGVETGGTLQIQLEYSIGNDLFYVGWRWYTWGLV